MTVRFFVGLHQPSDAWHFYRACISVKRLIKRKAPIRCGEVLLDSGAFTELNLHGHYRHSVAEYAREIRRIAETGVARVVAAVAQDYMCEPFILAKTGLMIADHQRLTIERYDALVAEGLPVPILPVLQGYAPEDYLRHLEAYGGRLTHGMWVGVGSVCKRNSNPAAIYRVLRIIKDARPDLRLHGFGIKLTALADPFVRALLESADSMAWSYSAKKQGRSANDWREASHFCRRVAQLVEAPA